MTMTYGSVSSRLMTESSRWTMAAVVEPVGGRRTGGRNAELAAGTTAPGICSAARRRALLRGTAPALSKSAGSPSAAVASASWVPAGCTPASNAPGQLDVINVKFMRSATGPQKSGATSLRNQAGSPSSPQGPVAVGRSVSSILNNW